MERLTKKVDGVWTADGWAGSDWTPADGIIHWMPLPKAPKEETNG